MPIGSYGNSVGSVNGSNIGQIKLERMGDTLNPLANRLNKLENVALKKKEIADQRAYDDGVRADQNQFSKDMQDNRQTFQAGESVKDRTFKTNERVADQTYLDGRYDIELKDGIKKEERLNKRQIAAEDRQNKFQLQLLGAKEASQKRVYDYKNKLSADAQKIMGDVSGSNDWVYSDKGFSKTDRDAKIKEFKESQLLSLKSSLDSSIKSLTDKGMPIERASELVSLFGEAAKGNKKSSAKVASMIKSGELRDLGIDMLPAKISTHYSGNDSTKLKEFIKSLPKLREPTVNVRETQKKMSESSQRILYAANGMSGANKKLAIAIYDEKQKEKGSIDKYLMSTDKDIASTKKDVKEQLAKTNSDNIKELKSNISAIQMDGDMSEYQKEKTIQAIIKTAGVAPEAVNHVNRKLEPGFFRDTLGK